MSCPAGGAQQCGDIEALTLSNKTESQVRRKSIFWNEVSVFGEGEESLGMWKGLWLPGVYSFFSYQDAQGKTAIEVSHSWWSLLFSLGTNYRLQRCDGTGAQYNID